MIHYTACPICSSSQITPVIKARDHTVSSEAFQIFSCSNCTARFTQDVADAKGIGKYYQSSKYISHSNTQEGFINKLYHTVRKRTLQGKKNIVKKYLGKQSGRLLDIGAGTGFFAKTMQDAGWNVTGLEPDEAARNIALLQNGISLSGLENLSRQEEHSFDAITLWHVLEHVHTLHEYCDIFNKILQKDGVLLIAVPNHTSSDAKHYGEHWAAYDVPRHLYHFSPASMQVLMKAHGFKVVKMLPMWFDSLYVSMLSEEYKNGKPNLLSAFWNGLKSNLLSVNKNGNCSSVIYVCKKKN